MTRGQLILALVAVAIVLLIIGYAADQDWLVAITVLVIVGALVFYALNLLARGQREWFGRDQQRRDDRENR
jgi:hypothetical protein